MARRNANIAPSHISREVHLELISWAYEIGWQQGRPKTMQLRTRMECVGSLPGLRKGVHRKKTETRRKIVKGSRKACWETSPKVSERLLGTRWRSPEEDYKTRRRECQRLSDCRSDVISLVVMYDCNI
ncbi:hypothetical protein GW17_00036407 [Ensete ventricosum]|nr:hypothetical protein GW17_00036407 [Ensete ventricosum]